MVWRSGSLAIRQEGQFLPTGAVIYGHKHEFDHTTFFIAGLWKVECFGEVYDSTGHVRLDEKGNPELVKLREVVIKGGAPLAWFLIEADKTHKLTLLRGPGCYACVYTHRGFVEELGTLINLYVLEVHNPGGFAKKYMGEIVARISELSGQSPEEIIKSLSVASEPTEVTVEYTGWHTAYV